MIGESSDTATARGDKARKGPLPTRYPIVTFDTEHINYSGHFNLLLLLHSIDLSRLRG